MQGRTVTNAQKIYWDNLCQVVGCIVCRKEGNFNNYVSIHHLDGRTKPNAHWLVLPLCASHHQDNGLAVAVHPYKKRFEQTYGNQYQLITECIDVLQRQGLVVPKKVLEIIGKGVRVA